MKGLTFFMSLLCMIIGCSSDDSAIEPWDPTQPGYALTQGLYTIDYSIEEDSCVWSLSDLMQSDHWPPSHGTISASNNIGALVDIQYLRATGIPTSYAAEYYDNRLAQSGVYASDFDVRSNVRCADGSPEPLYHRRKLIIRSLKDNELEVEVRNDWDVQPDVLCPNGGIESTSGVYTAIPLETCTESYTMTYKLAEPCAQPCRITPTVTPYADEETGMEYIIFTEGQWCTCPDEE